MSTNKNSGFIKLILLIIVVILILSYFGISLRNVANSKVGKDNFDFLKEVGQKTWSFCLSVWDTYLAEKAMYIWDEIILKFGGNFVIENIDKLRK